MADENWQKVRKVFDVAVGYKPDERKSLMETPTVAKAADIIEAETKKLACGTCFGHYETIEQIGTGGMGEVYPAQDKSLTGKLPSETFANLILQFHPKAQGNRLTSLNQN